MFTGGIGEHSSSIREAVCLRLQHIGVKLDVQKNVAASDGIISMQDSDVLVTVIPANEELGVARESARCVLYSCRK